MKSKVLFLAAAFALFSISSYAQFRQSIGASAILGTGNIPEGAEIGYAEQPTIAGWGVFYYPRFMLNQTGSVTVGIPLSAGISGSYNSRSGNSISLLADLPITADYNFGAGSNDENESKFGGFVGGGFSYTYSSYSDEFYIPGAVEYYERVNGTSYGPLIHGGMKVAIGNQIFFARGFFKMGLEKAKFKTFGFSVGLDF